MIETAQLPALPPLETRKYRPTEVWGLMQEYARAAIAMAAEECAKVADAMAEDGEHASGECAERIRARFVHSPKPLT